MAPLYRTFIQLDNEEKDIVQKVRRFMRKPNGKLPPQSDAIRAIIREYWDVLVAARKQADPD
jgi:hypothetical protein